MDPLHFCIAAVPLAVYALMIGILNLSGRPFVTTGARDIAALGIGVGGLVVAGPMELFFPEGAAARFGPYVWLLLIIFYGLCVSLTVLLMRPRLVVYNINVEQLRPIITEIAMELDPNSRWTGDSLIIPKSGIHLQMEGIDWLRNVQLEATGNKQNFDGWSSLEKRLKQETRTQKVPPNTLGLLMMGIAGCLAVFSAGWMLFDREAVAQAFENMLRK